MHFVVRAFASAILDGYFRLQVVPTALPPAGVIAMGYAGAIILFCPDRRSRLPIVGSGRSAGFLLDINAENYSTHAGRSRTADHQNQ